MPSALEALIVVQEQTIFVQINNEHHKHSLQTTFIVLGSFSSTTLAKNWSKKGQNWAKNIQIL